MRKYSVTWAATQKLTSIPIKSSLPNPFPGAWPTRMYWRVSPLEGPVRVYLGKPISTRAWEFQKLMRNLPHATGVIVEFDRKNLPIYSWSNFTGTRVFSHLFTYYHYWQSPDPQAGHLTLNNYPQDQSGKAFYAPFRTLSPSRRADWQAYLRHIFYEVPA